MRFPLHLEAIQVYLNVAQMSIHIFWVDFMWRVMWMQSFQHLWPRTCLACGIILLPQLCSKQRRWVIYWLVMHGLYCTVYISWIHASPQRLAFHFHLSKGRQYSTNRLLDYYIVKVEAICLMTTSAKWFFLLPYVCLVISHVYAF
jgi:hypothetical protein